jgi:hypothetical protein
LTPGPGSGIRNRFLSDLGSPIPKPYILELSYKFLGKKFYNSLKTGPNIFSAFQKLSNFNFVKFVATKKGMTTNFCSPLSFVEAFGSGIQDPGWVKNQNPGSGINIPDPQHWDIRSRPQSTGYQISDSQKTIGCRPLPMTDCISSL